MPKPPSTLTFAVKNKQKQIERLRLACLVAWQRDLWLSFVSETNVRTGIVPSVDVLTPMEIEETSPTYQKNKFEIPREQVVVRGLT